jgi:hypothetical protein
MSAEEELAFLEAHLGELSQAVLRQLKRDIIAAKNREARALKARGRTRTNNPPACAMGANPARLAREGGEAALSQKAPLATTGKRKTIQLDSSNSGGSLEPATSRPGHYAEPGPHLCLYRQIGTPTPLQANTPRPAAWNSVPLM